MILFYLKFSLLNFINFLFDSSLNWYSIAFALIIFPFIHLTNFNYIILLLIFKSISYNRERFIHDPFLII